MSTYLIGCLHFQHEWMAKYRGFQDSFYHDEYLIEEWNKIVNKNDSVLILGDITMEKKEPYYMLDRLNGHKTAILGNHDMPQHIPELLKYVDKVAGMMDYKGCALTHAPIHPSEMCFYRANIHAHIHHLNKLHECFIPDRYGDIDKENVYATSHKYINVDAKLIDFKPRLLDDLLAQRSL